MIENRTTESQGGCGGWRDTPRPSMLGLFPATASGTCALEFRVGATLGAQLCGVAWFDK
jgi:hypothetical protein